MLLPVALNLENRRVLVVGGGAVAARKARACLEAGALLTAISPHFSSDFPLCEKIHRRFQNGDCAGFSLVFAATNSGQTNAQILEQCRELGVWCNVADDPQNSDFHTASVVRRGEIAIGVTTGGLSPVVARSVRESVEEAVGPEWETLLEWLRAYCISPKNRGDFWRQIVHSEILALLREGQNSRAKERLESLLLSLENARKEE